MISATFSFSSNILSTAIVQRNKNELKYEFSLFPFGGKMALVYKELNFYKAAINVKNVRKKKLLKSKLLLK